MTLCIFDGEHQPLAEVPCHRTDSHWHVHLDGLPGSGLTYGYRVEGKGGWETGEGAPVPGLSPRALFAWVMHG